jgi:tRNA(Arg) A34 adenosine deaminase TadA
MNKYMKVAIKEAKDGITQGHGGPFGVCIVKDNKIIGRGHNRVVLNNDCTCHGEMEAIRDACKNIIPFFRNTVNKMKQNDGLSYISIGAVNSISLMAA